MRKYEYDGKKKSKKYQSGDEKYSLFDYSSADTMEYMYYPYYSKTL